MAAVVRLSSGNIRQVALRIPSIICRFRCSATTVGSGDTKKPSPPSSSTAGKDDAADNSTYKVGEYFSYNEYSFYDLENVIDSTGRRQIQPDPKVKYIHTDPWTTKEKSAV